MEGVYILHFDYPVKFTSQYSYGNCTHYVGKTSDIRLRIKRHKLGTGSAFTRAAYAQGVAFTAYGFKYASTHANERYVTKNVAEMCPQCNGSDVSIEFMPQWTKHINPGFQEVPFMETADVSPPL